MHRTAGDSAHHYCYQPDDRLGGNRTRFPIARNRLMHRLHTNPEMV